MKLDPLSSNGHRALALGDCWAKTDSSNAPVLNVLDHCRHVGAVGKEIASRLGHQLGALIPEGGIFLVAAHDIGKISPGFLLQCSHWKNRWQGALQLSAQQLYENRHAWISQKCLADLMSKAPLSLIAVGGHHGRYLCQTAKPTSFRSVLVGDGIFQELRLELVEILEKEFGSRSGEDPLANGSKGARLHWFTGLMIFSDWIGSNTTWFGPEIVQSSAAETKAVAARALDEIGWGRHSVGSGASFADLFQLPKPNALQTALFQAADAPGLYIVEAPMGEGKTEAALFAAQRRWSEGSERGLYFALPTQLTSNRIHQRVEDFLIRTVKDWSSIALVHGNAWLEENRIKPLPPSSSDCESQDVQPGNQWFSDSRRALLAPFGVGTIDQALMAVLPVKFSALRLFALGGKVVVIDEVHSYDAYTSALVDRAVQWLLEMHCTVIILSATLTTARRESLVKAAGASPSPDTDSVAYPLITKVRSDSARVEVIEIPEAAPEQKNIEIETCADPSWMEQAARAAEGGACVLVLRNTVALAQETFRALKEKCRSMGDMEIEFGCIHSRFTQADRSANESAWMEKLGKNQARRPAGGAILVGTQVLEQSVDIDADFLITDTAPTDLILQRLGRLHRHSRPRPTGFERPRCLLLLPVVDWQAETKNIKGALSPHHFVYPPFHLYMTEKIWGQRNTIQIPGEIRDVLEESAAVPSDLPTGAAALLREYLQEVKKRTETALRRGPFSATPLDDIEGAQTRWIDQASAYLILLREKPRSSAGQITLVFGEGIEHILTPGVFDFSLARLLHLRAVRLSRYLIQDALKFQPSWLTQHFPGAVLATVNDLNQVELISDNGSTAYEFTYHPVTGLAHARKPSVSSLTFEDDASWF